MFQFPGSRCRVSWDQCAVGRSPTLLAACHARPAVKRQLMAPRHPPRALVDLTTPTRRRRLSAVTRHGMIGFGIFGYLLRKTGFPAAPLVLAMILGPILERSLQQAMISSAGDPLIFVQHPLSAALLGAAALVALTPLLSLMRGGSTKPA